MTSRHPRALWPVSSTLSSSHVGLSPGLGGLDTSTIDRTARHAARGGSFDPASSYAHSVIACDVLRRTARPSFGTAPVGATELPLPAPSPRLRRGLLRNGDRLLATTSTTGIPRPLDPRYRSCRRDATRRALIVTQTPPGRSWYRQWARGNDCPPTPSRRRAPGDGRAPRLPCRGMRTRTTSTRTLGAHKSVRLTIGRHVNGQVAERCPDRDRRGPESSVVAGKVWTGLTISSYDKGRRSEDRRPEW